MFKLHFESANGGMSVRLIITLLVASIISFIHVGQSSAAGLTTHLIVGEEVRGRVHNEQLKTLLAETKEAFRKGVVHPDVYRRIDGVADKSDGHVMGCWKQGDNCEIAEEPNWMNEYLALLRTTENNIQRKKAFAYGAMTHIVTDVIYDKHFVFNKKEGIYEKCTTHEKSAGWHSDWDLDICLSGLAQNRLISDDKIRDMCNKIKVKEENDWDWVKKNGKGAASACRRNNNQGNCYLLEKDDGDGRPLLLTAYKNAGIEIIDESSLKFESNNIWKVLEREPKIKDIALNRVFSRLTGNKRKDFDSNCQYSTNHFRKEIERAADVSAWFVRETHEALKKARKNDNVSPPEFNRDAKWVIKLMQDGNCLASTNINTNNCGDIPDWVDKSNE